MVDSEEFPLDPNITTDCFWNAVNAIEKNYSSSGSTIQSAFNQNNNGSGLNPCPKPLSNVTNNSLTTNITPKTRRRTSSISSTSSNSSNTSNSSKKRKNKFKCPKPVNSNTTYYKQYAQKYKAKSPPNAIHNNNPKPIAAVTTRIHSQSRNRNPLLLSQTASKPDNTASFHMNGTHSNNVPPKIISKSHSYPALHSKTSNTNITSSNTNTNVSISSNTNDTTSNTNASMSTYDTGSYTSSYRSNNNVFSASCTAGSISRINRMDDSTNTSKSSEMHDPDGFAVPTASFPSRRKMNTYQSPKQKQKQKLETRKTQKTQNTITYTQSQDAINKLIQCKKEMARLRRETRHKEETLRADVDVYKRRVNDSKKEAFAAKEKLKKYQSTHHDKYTKQFQTLRSKIRELQQQRDSKEREVVEYCSKNKDLNMKLHKEKDTFIKMKDQYSKLYNKFEENKTFIQELKEKEVQTPMNIHKNISIQNQNQNQIQSQSAPIHKHKKNRKRKLDESSPDLSLSDSINPKKKIKLSSSVMKKEIKDGDELYILKDECDNTNRDISMTASYRSGTMNFKNKESIIEYEMKQITELLIEEMSGDPLDELGIFMQSLSINKRTTDIDHQKHYEIINAQRQKWQQLLNENWFLSKQTVSLVPLIRFLFQLLSECNFNHILPMSSAIKILLIIFNGSKLYRNMLFESVIQSNNIKKNEKKDKKRKRKRKKKKKKSKHKNSGFWEKMIERNGNHLLIIEKENKEEKQDKQHKSKEENDDIEMKDIKDENNNNNNDNNKALSMKGRLPNIPCSLIEILRVIQNHIYSPNSKKNITTKEKQRVFIANADHLCELKYQSSQLEYECLLLIYRFLFYAQSNARMNSIMFSLILSEIDLIIGVLCGKLSTLKSKIICIKMMHLLIMSNRRKYYNAMTSTLIKRNSDINAGRMDCGNGDDEEPTLLYYVLESLFCCSRFDLFCVDEMNRKDILSMCLDIVLYRQQVIKLISDLVSHKNKKEIFHQKIMLYRFNFKYCSFKYLKLVTDDRIKTKLHHTKQPFFHLLSQLIIYMDQIQNGLPTDLLCTQFKNQEIAAKYPHVLQEFNDKIMNLMDFVCDKVNEKEEDSEIVQINREFLKNLNSNQSKKDENENKEHNDKINTSDIPQETKDLIEIYFENVLEKESFWELQTCANGNSFAILYKERRILMAMMLKLMLMCTEFMNHNDIKSCLKCDQFEIMTLLKRYMKQDDDDDDESIQYHECAKQLYHKLNNQIDILSDIYEDDM